MRRSTLINAIVVLLFTTGCACSCVPLRQYGQEPAPEASVVTEFDEVITGKVANLGPMPQVRKQAVSGDVSLNKALSVINNGWRRYLDMLHDGRLDNHPTLIEGKELDGNGYADVCRQEKSHRFPEPVFPLNCINPQSGGVKSALAVWPEGYTHKVQEFADAHTERDGWVLASLVAGLSYADHVRAEMRELKFLWPDGRPFDYCVVGIGLRAVFPADIQQLKETDLPAILAALDELVSPPDDPEARLVNLTVGFTTGRLASCLG